MLTQCTPDDIPANAPPALQRHLEDYEKPGGRWGFLDHDGNIRIKAQFDEVGSFNEGLAPASIKGLWGYIDVDGKWAVDPQFIKVHSYVNGQARVRGSDGMMGMINTRGDTIVPFVYDEIYTSNLDVYVVEAANKKGVINKTGLIVLDNMYESLHIIHNDLFAVSKGEKFDIINSVNDILLQNIYHIKKGGLVRTADGWGAISRTGAWLIEPVYDNISFGGDNIFIVKQKSNYAIIDLVNTLYTSKEKIKYLGTERFAVRTIDGWSLIDRNGDPLLDNSFDSIYAFHEDIAAFEIDRRWGYLDKNGQVVIPPAFFLPWQSHQDKIRLFNGSAFGFMNKRGALVIEAKYDDVRDFSEGLAAFQVR